MANYGQIFSANDIAKQLKEANRTYEGLKTWEQLYGSVNIAEQQMMSSLKQDYSKEIGQAYLSSLQQEQDILTSNIGQGYKEQMLSENQLALEEAFEAYQQNYLQGVQSISENTAKATSQITSQLEQQADYTKQFAESPYQYLSYLYDEYNDNELFTQDEWKRYLTTDEEGVERLKTWEELTQNFFDENNELTTLGVDFYDQMLNQIAQGEYGLPSYGKWLSETNEDLFNWMQTYNPYNYTEAGTQFGTLKTMLGLKSTDDTYTFAERFAGMSKEEVDESLSKFIDYSNKLSQSTSNIKDIKNYTNEIKSLITKYGLSEDLAKEGINIDELDRVVEKALETYQEPDTVNSNPHKNFFGTVWDWMVGAGRTIGKTGKLLVTGRKDYTFDDFEKDVKDIWTDYDTDMSNTQEAILMYKNLVQLVSSLAQEKRKKAQT